MATLNADTATAYLAGLHACPIKVTDIREFTEEGTPAIAGWFSLNESTFVEKATVWLEERDDGTTFIYGEW